jgi:hypothetical protein
LEDAAERRRKGDRQPAPVQRDELGPGAPLGAVLLELVGQLAPARERQLDAGKGGEEARP